MEPHSLVGGMGEGGWSGIGLACGLQDQRLMARPPAWAGGRSGLLTAGKSGKSDGYSLPFPKGYLPTSPARPAGGRAVTIVPMRGPQARYQERSTASPYTTPPEKGVPGEEPPPRGFFPPFLPKKWGPGRAGQGSLPFQRRGQNPQHPQPLKKCAFVPGQAGTRTHCQLLNCTKLSDRHRLERGVDDLSPIQIPSLQTVNENLRRGGVGGERNVVLVAHLVDILQVGVQVAGLGV